MLERSSIRRPVARGRVVFVGEEGAVERPDRLATEEPMEIRAGGPGQDPERIAVTMRTPGNDFELAAGFLYTEGLAGRDEVVTVAYCDLPGAEQEYNVVTVRLARRFDQAALRRNFFATSSCGLCGKASLDQVEVRCDPLPAGPVVARRTLLSLPSRLRRSQRLFDQTGGLHAAALFDPDGELLTLREDVGRHNAVDKVVGSALLGGALPLHGRILLVSGRAGFEIVQKAAVAGIPVVCAVSAPSSLAVAAGERFGMTVVGFLRERGFNVYTAPERIDVGGASC